MITPLRRHLLRFNQAITFAAKSMAALVFFERLPPWALGPQQHHIGRLIAATSQFSTAKHNEGRPQLDANFTTIATPPLCQSSLHSFSFESCRLLLCCGLVPLISCLATSCVPRAWRSTFSGGSAKAATWISSPFVVAHASKLGDARRRVQAQARTHPSNRLHEMAT